MVVGNVVHTHHNIEYYTELRLCFLFCYVVHTLRNIEYSANYILKPFVTLEIVQYILLCKLHDQEITIDYVVVSVFLRLTHVG